MTRWFISAGMLTATCLLSGCHRSDSHEVQGYVEGEFVYVASPLAGALESLHVQRGEQVKAGEALFDLERARQQALRDEVDRRAAQARADLQDLQKGKRPSEMESLDAQLQQAQAALTLAEADLARVQKLIHTGAASAQDLDRAQSEQQQASQRVAQLQADITTARLGSRADQIKAAQANVAAAEAALAAAEWDLAQKHQAAPQAGLVLDTLYRQGEWVAAGRPVVVLLPPQNIKVRAFVPEGRIGAIHAGDRVRVTVDGVAKPLIGKVSFISPQAEYTPPVIYSRQSRGKLVFMIEAVFDPQVAATLHPGQPVDVELESAGP
jgi:HlyD family secretion protein